MHNNTQSSYTSQLCSSMLYHSTLTESWREHYYIEKYWKHVRYKTINEEY